MMLTLEQVLEGDECFTVDGYDGIAFYVKREHIEEYYDDEAVSTGMVVAVMVGDDREHIIDPSDMTLLDDDDYCSGCGQVGCGH